MCKSHMAAALTSTATEAAHSGPRHGLACANWKSKLKLKLDVSTDYEIVREVFQYFKEPRDQL